MYIIVIVLPDKLLDVFSPVSKKIFQFEIQMQLEILIIIGPICLRGQSLLYAILAQYQNGEGANYTQKKLPVSLVYWEEYERIDDAFYREKQIQGWSRRKKLELIAGDEPLLHELSKCKNSTHFNNR